MHVYTGVSSDGPFTCDVAIQIIISGLYVGVLWPLNGKNGLLSHWNVNLGSCTFHHLVLTIKNDKLEWK